jgi:hypothetical protein
MHFHPIHIIRLLPVEATQNIKRVSQVLQVYYYTLMECAGCGLKLVDSNLSSPSLSLKFEFVNIIESLLRLINTSEDIHRSLGSTCTVTIAALNVTVHPNRFEPYFFIKV